MKGTEPNLTASGGWTNPFPGLPKGYGIPLPEVTARRGGIQFTGSDPIEQITQRYALKMRQLAGFLRTTVEHIEHLNDGAEGGYWEYGVMDENGEVITGGTSYAPEPHRSALDAFASQNILDSDVIVRRWVPAAGEWGVVQ